MFFLFGAGIVPMDLSLGIGSFLSYGTMEMPFMFGTLIPTTLWAHMELTHSQFADGTALTYSQLIDRGFNLAGTSGDDSLIGTNVMDRVSGLSGDDMIQAGNGNDVLDGGTGVDILVGGTGDDIYLVDNADDVVTELADQGSDTALSSATFALGMNIENLTLTGSTTSMRPAMHRRTC